MKMEFDHELRNSSRRQDAPCRDRMSTPNPWSTRITLLERVARSEETAWQEFVAHYGPMILRWCQRGGLQPADASDVSQEVLLRLARRLKDFAYDPSRSFRSWLKVVTNHALQDYIKQQQRPGHGSGDSVVLTFLNNLQAREDLLTDLESDFDRDLLQVAMSRVRLAVATHTWEAFRLTAQEGVAPTEAAAQLEMSVGAVYQARSSVSRRLRDLISEMKAEMGGERSGLKGHP
jgi:RNA polymerase sigma-70 factor (ECF subfamily)